MHIHLRTLAAFTAGFLLGISPLALEPLTVKPAMRHVEGYTPALTLTSAADAPAKRQFIIDYIFGGTLPDTLPVEQGDLLVMTLPDGFTSTAHYTPGTRDTLVIYHSGHITNYAPDAVAVQAFTEAGYPVMFMDMPLVGRNRRADLRFHNQFWITPLNVPALRLFVEPVVQVVNWAQGQGFRRVVMVGLSGGGWTTVLASAVDTRIALSVPVAGSTPLGLALRDTAPDYEQLLPGLALDMMYEDLYVMGAQGRTQVQIVNEFDPCCHNYDAYPLYETAVQQMLGNAGRFAVWLDRGEAEHRVSPAALAMMIEVFRA